MNAPTDFYGHIANKVCVSKKLTLMVLRDKETPSCLKKGVSDVEAVGFIMPLSVFVFFFKDAGKRSVARLKSEGMDTAGSGACRFS